MKGTMGIQRREWKKMDLSTIELETIECQIEHRTELCCCCCCCWRSRMWMAWRQRKRRILQISWTWFYAWIYSHMKNKGKRLKWTKKKFELHKNQNKKITKKNPEKLLDVDWTKLAQIIIILFTDFFVLCIHTYSHSHSHRSLSVVYCLSFSHIFRLRTWFRMQQRIMHELKVCEKTRRKYERNERKKNENE